MTRKKRLTETVHAALVGNTSCRVSVEQAAAHIDKRPSTLYAEMNPYDAGAKLGLDDAHDLMRLLRSTALVEVMAADMQCRVVPMDGHEPDGRDMNEELLQGFEATAQYLEAARRGAASTVELHALLERAIVELEDVWKRARAANG